MATWAVGDVQGCCAELDDLLEALSFDPARDALWLVGDLVNRGPDSLGVLRRVHDLGAAATVVLGNHDLHLLALHRGGHPVRRGDTLDAVLAAPDRDLLLDWLGQQPLLHDDPQRGVLMVHAGIPPGWALAEVLERAAAARACYAGAQGEVFFPAMYGDRERVWRDDLDPLAQVRCTVNHLTRMRLLDAEGELDFAYKGGLADKPAHLCPWFALPRRVPLGRRVLFGHWAALAGRTDHADAVALDTGCVWGQSLTAMNVDSGERRSVPARPGS